MQASGTVASPFATGNFRLTDDVGIGSPAPVRNQYTADFVHRKFKTRTCKVLYTTTAGSRVTCTNVTGAAWPGGTGYTYQDG